MAAKKKSKAKAKKAKKAKKKSPARKKPAAKRAVRKPAAKKKVAPKKKKPAAKAKSAKPKAAPAKRPVAKAPAPKPAAPVAGPGEERVGIVTHYYNHLMVAIVKLESGSIGLGDVVHIKGHTSDFSQTIDSLEVEHVHVNAVNAGQSFGLRVKEHAREHDTVFKVKR
jgi:hypothetical protein